MNTNVRLQLAINMCSLYVFGRKTSTFCHKERDYVNDIAAQRHLDNWYYILNTQVHKHF